MSGALPQLRVDIVREDPTIEPTERPYLLRCSIGFAGTDRGCVCDVANDRPYTLWCPRCLWSKTPIVPGSAPRRSAPCHFDGLPCVPPARREPWSAEFRRRARLPIFPVHRQHDASRNGKSCNALAHRQERAGRLPADFCNDDGIRGSTFGGIFEHPNQGKTRGVRGGPPRCYSLRSGLAFQRQLNQFVHLLSAVGNLGRAGS